MATTKILGAWGETLAAQYLQKKRYRLEAAGYRCKYGEIDLIVTDRKYLVFVEVKLRKSGGVTRPADAVGRAKQSRLRATADIWLAQNPEYSGMETDFTVAQLYTNAEGMIEKMELIEEAF